MPTSAVRIRTFVFFTPLGSRVPRCSEFDKILQPDPGNVKKIEGLKIHGKREIFKDLV